QTCALPILLDHCDEVCKSHDLSVVKEHNASVRHTLAEQHLLEKNKISWKDELREAIEYARDNSTNFDSFKRHLNDVYGVETKLRSEERRVGREWKARWRG